MQLGHFHKGWENEHLASFLLSRLAFVANPATVGDDVGTDIFCTLFEVREHQGKPTLMPRHSIAVQVKSNRDPVDVAPHLDYLDRLEIPYYLGVVDQRKLTLELFSARLLPALLSLKGSTHTKLLLQPVDVFQREFRPVDKNGVHSLLCHRVATLDAHDGPDATSEAAIAIREDSRAALQAIVSRLNKEYLFAIPGGEEVEFYAGSSSAQTFRHSLYKRLAEAYYNFSWLIESGIAASDAEMDAYVNLADELGKANTVPEWVLKLRSGLQQRRLNRAEKK